MSLHAIVGLRLGSLDLEADIGRAQRALDGDDEERHRHERLRHDDAGRRERQRDPQPGVEVAADQPFPAEGEEQRDAPHDRRQDEREHHQCP